MRVLMIDNRDSFTFNLVQALRVLGAEVLVERADLLEVDAARALEPTHVVVSPGPGTPERAGNSLALIEAFLGHVPLLGVCLGHQALGVVLGAIVERAPAPVHGKASRVYHDGRTLYRGVPNPFLAARYHSLTLREGALGQRLEVSAHGADGEIFGVRSASLKAEGVQFHPESVLTPDGPRLLANFLGVQARATEPLVEVSS